jgi:hypothetical protein
LDSNQTDKLIQADAQGGDDLTLKHISGAFYLLGGCLVVCCLLFVVECVVAWVRIRKKKRKKEKKELIIQLTVKYMDTVL